MRLANSCDGDGLGDDDLAHDFRLIDFAVHPQPLALAGAADRGEAACALFLVGKRTGDGQLTVAAPGFVAPDRGCGTPRVGPAMAGGRGLLFFLYRQRRLARGGKRGKFGGRGLAGAFGDLAARLFLLALRLGALGAFLGFFVGALARLLFLRLPPRVFFGPALCFLGGARRFLATAIGFGECGALPRFDIRLLRVLDGPQPPGSLVRCQRTRHRNDAAWRFALGRGCRHGRRGHGQRRACNRRRGGGLRLRRLGRGCARHDDPLLADLDGDKLRRPCENCCLTWPGSDGRFRPSVPPVRRVRGRFCSWSTSLMLSRTTIPPLRPSRSQFQLAGHCRRRPKPGEPPEIGQ